MKEWVFSENPGKAIKNPMTHIVDLRGGNRMGIIKGWEICSEKVRSPEQRVRGLRLVVGHARKYRDPPPLIETWLVHPRTPQ